jgi:hypothetical protein
MSENKFPEHEEHGIEYTDAIVLGPNNEADSNEFVETSPVAEYIGPVPSTKPERPDKYAYGTKIRHLYPGDAPRFIKKSELHLYDCFICKWRLVFPYRGLEKKDVGVVEVRKSAVLKLGCGGTFHIGCLRDYLRGKEYEVTLDDDGQQTEKLVRRNSSPFILCPDKECGKLSITQRLKEYIIKFIGEEKDITTPLKEWRSYEGPEYTNFILRNRCIGSGCTMSGGKRKTKNKIKKKKRTRKQTKKRKQKLNKTKRKNSKK